MLSIYQLISSNLNKSVADHGEIVLKQPLVKNMRVVKREILTLISIWISRAFDADNISLAKTVDEVLRPIFTTVLTDYKLSVPAAREPKVLSLLSVSIVSLKVRLKTKKKF